MTYQPGHLLLDKYRIEALIGQGVFGDVYRAVHLKLNQVRAIKVLRRDMPGVSSEDFRKTAERFQFEAQLGARLDHPNVIKVHDFEESEGELYLVMEYAPGGNLQDRLAKAGILSISDAVRLGAELCAGLDALHSKLQAVHRDIKPSNILFGENGLAKIADLGLAQALDGASQRSQLGSLAGRHPGTPLYMSPEQETTSAYLLPTSDVFAVGCVLFEALTGKAYKSVYGSRARDHRADAPLWLDEIVARALAEQPGRLLEDDANPAKRYREVRQLRNALKQGWQRELAKKPEQNVAQPINNQVNRAETIKSVQIAQPSPKPKIHASLRKWGIIVTWGVAAIGIFIVILAVYQFRLSLQASPGVPSKTPVVTSQATLTNTSTSTNEIIKPATVTPTLEITAIPSPRTVDKYAEMALIPAGKLKGLAINTFYIGKYEVTNMLYQLCVDAGICSPPAKTTSAARSSYYGNAAFDNYPVIHVNWNQANAYCEWRDARLPNQVEWEYAGRGNEGRLYPWGNSQANCTRANFICKGTDGILDTEPVGSRESGKTPEDVYDLIGNVREWVNDSSGSERIVSANGYTGSGNSLNLDYSVPFDPNYSSPSTGFRCARSK